ncbi:MAG: DNA translocase FtsK [Pseudomonadota bacterium]|nr:DNA translocase FtsK [Pseudomonadota bacterium]
MRRLAWRLAGAGLIFVAVCGWTALASWSIRDPSLNNATRGEPANLLGQVGATLADLMMQSIGLAAIFAFLPLAAWGWHLRSPVPPERTRARLSAWPIGVLALAGGLSALPTPSRWPLPNGLGGILGDLTAATAKLLLSLLPAIITGTLVAVILLMAGTGAVLFASGVGAGAYARVWRGETPEDEESLYDSEDEDDEDEEADDEDDEEDSERRERGDGFLSPTLGAAVHWILSLKARYARGPRRELVPAGGGGRREPTLGPRYARDGAGRLEPGFDDMEDEGYEDAEDGEEDAPGYEITRGEVSSRRARAKRRRQPQPESYDLPPVRLLRKVPRTKRGSGLTDQILQENAHQLEAVLQDFGVKGEIVNVRPGPVVTLYELEPAPGTKSSRVIALADDIARSMSAVACRVAVIPGRNAIGIELPNEEREMVFLREIVENEDFADGEGGLMLALGKNIGGESVVVDLARMPHLLIAGTTGSGKSVGINTMILSLLYRLTPDQCKFIMIDPKMLELSVYDGIPHLLAPVVTDPKKAVVALKWTVREMEERYKRMSKLGVRNVANYNARVIEAEEEGETLTRTVQTGFDKETGEAIYEEEEMDYEPMPYLVVIVDEMADLMMVAGKEIEGAVQRLAQMARAAGIHMITATQRPSVDVITGTIKANFPTRISFQVTSKIDSRTILNEQGAEQLLGQGDMLYMAGGGRITRVHGPFVSDEEVEKVVGFLKKQGVPEYLDAVTEESDEDEDEDSGGEYAGSGDELFDQAVGVVLRDGKASTSYIQRRLSIGYNRAATLIERMEEEGIISPANHAGKREILARREDD